MSRTKNDGAGPAKAVSRVLEHPAAEPGRALPHFQAKLSCETDPADVRFDQQNGETGFVLVDARSPEAYARGCVPGAVNLHYRKMDAATTASLPKDKLIVVYCASAACNASTKGAARLSALGFRVKEMLGGLESWEKEGYPVETGEPAGALSGRK